MTRRRLLPTALALAAAMIPTVALAHPLGNFSVNHYAAVRVSERSVAIDLVIDMAEIPALDGIAALDRDADGRADPDELEAARGASCAALEADQSVTIGGSRLPLELAAAGMHVAAGAGGLATLRTVCTFVAPLPVAVGAGSVLTFRDDSFAERIGWREIVVLGDGVTIEEPTDAAEDVSDRLTRYPADLLSQPLNEREIAATLRPGGSALAQWSAADAWPLDAASVAESGRPDASVPGGVAGELASIVDFRNLSLPLALLGLAIAAITGAGHALSPGHGKTVMAAYLIGSRGGTRHAFILGGAVTVSHTIGVLALAALVLAAGGVLPPERLYPVLTVISGATVVAIGAALLVGCVRRARRPAAHDQEHDGAHSHGAHSHGAHSHGGRTHTHAPPSAPGWRGLAALGVAGGLVPSTSALILLLGAVSAGQPAYGLALALAFGVGMAVVLTGIGLAMVHGRVLVTRAGARLPGIGRAAAALPWVTAVIVLAGGLVLTGQTLAASL